MKRTFAVVIMGVTAGTSIALAAPGNASSAAPAAPAASVSVLSASGKPKPQVMPSATLRDVSSWTFRVDAMLACHDHCSVQYGIHVITPTHMSRPVLHQQH